VLRGLLVIRVEDAVAIEKCVHRLGYADASLGGGAAQPSRERIGIRRMHQQPHRTHAPRTSPALYRVLPAEIADAHPVFTETPNVMRVECAFGSPVEDRIGVQKNPVGVRK
jgi:hypothetical protein